MGDEKKRKAWVEKKNKALGTVMEEVEGWLGDLKVGRRGVDLRTVEVRDVRRQ